MVMKRDPKKDPPTEYYEYDPIKSKEKFRHDMFWGLLYRTFGAPFFLLVFIIAAIIYWIF